MELELNYSYTDRIRLKVACSVDFYEFTIFDISGNEVQKFKCKVQIVHNTKLPLPYSGERLWAVQAFRGVGKVKLPELFK